MSQTDYSKAFRSTVLTYVAIIFVPAIFVNSWFALKVAAAFTMDQILWVGLQSLGINIALLALTLLLLKSRVKRLATLRQLQAMGKASAA